MHLSQVNSDGWITTTMDCYTYSRLRTEQEFGITESGQLLHFDKCVAVQNNLLLRTQTCGTDKSREQGTCCIHEYLLLLGWSSHNHPIRFVHWLAYMTAGVRTPAWYHWMVLGWSFEVAQHLGLQIGALKFTFDDGRTKCTQQITNVLELYQNRQMPQLIPCKEDKNWQRWFITYNLDYSLVPPRPVWLESSLYVADLTGV